MKYKKSIAVFLTAAMIMSVSSGCAKQEEKTDEVVQEEYIPVETSVIALGSISKELSYQGYVEANQTVNVTSKLSGIVENVYFDQGDFVNEGETLFTIDKKDINDNISSLEANLKVNEQSVASARTGLNQASSGGQIQTNRLQLENAVKSAQINVDTCKTSLNNAETALSNADTSIESAKKGLETAQTSLNTAQASFANTEKRYNDTKQLYDAGVVAKNDFDSVELAYTQARNAVTQAEKQVETATNSVTQAENGKVQAQNAITQAEKALENAENAYTQAKASLDIFDKSTSKDSVANAQNSVNTAIASKNAIQTQLDIAKSNLKDTVVKAPISGYITERNIEPSNMVSAQATPFVIVDVSKVTVNVKVSEKIINNVNVGDSVDVRIDTLGGGSIEGTIKSVSPVTDSTNTYPVKIEINNPSGAIKAGMFAKVYFTETTAGDAVVLPLDVVLSSGNNHYVYTVGADGRAVKTPVEIGLDNGTDIQITSGLNKGDTVIVNGQNYVEDGSLIKVVDDANALPNDTEDTTEEITSK